MFVRGLIEAIKVLKMCLKLFDRLISRSTLAILKVLMTDVELPTLTDLAVPDRSRLIVVIEARTITKSNMFHKSLKYMQRRAKTLITASNMKIAVKLTFT